MRSSRAIIRDKTPRRGRPENLKKGRKKGDPPTRKLSEQKVTEFCLYFLTHGESIKAAGLHIGLSPTYVYEFYKKPEVKAKLVELRSEIDDKTNEVLNQSICTRQFIDDHLASIIADPQTPPKDRIAALRLAAEIAGLTEKSKPLVQQTTFVAAQSIQTGPYLADRFAKLKQQGEYQSEHLTLTLPAAPLKSEVSKYDELGS